MALHSPVWKTGGPSPELKASWVSKMLWVWLNPLITLGCRKPLEAEDLYDMIPNESTVFCERVWKATYEKEKLKVPRVKVWKLIAFCGGIKLNLFSFCMMPIWLTSVVLQVYILKALVIVAADRDKKLEWWWASILVGGMMLTSNIQSISQHWNLTFGQLMGMKIRAGVSMAVFNKMMELRTGLMTGTSSGNMLNMITNDTQKLLDGATYFNFSCFSVVASMIVAGITIGEVGLAAIPGMFVIFMGQPIQFSIAAMVGKLRRRAVEWTDFRVRTVGETLAGVRVVKYNGWTTPFLKKIEDLRNSELQWIRRAAYFRASTSTIKDGLAPIATVVTFATYVGVHKGSFSAAKAFTVLGLYGILVRVFSIAPQGIQSLGESMIATERLQRFLDLPTLRNGKCTDDNKGGRTSDDVIVVSEATFSWDSNKDVAMGEPLAKSFSRRLTKTLSQTEGKIHNINVDAEGTISSRTSLSIHDNPAQTGLRGINLKVKKGELVGIIGPVGSGKSSLLNALLGEMECLRGTVSVEGTVAYVPQQPWILNSTIRNNIIFNTPFDKNRYRQTIAACALDHDIDQMPSGHDTEIGERGINLSGGQKARISLARACYSNSSVVILDDPLAAVDVPIAKHLIEHVLGKALKGRTVLLVTHNKTSLEQCTRVVVLDNGTLLEIMSHDKLKYVTESKELDIGVSNESDARRWSTDSLQSAGNIETLQSYNSYPGIAVESGSETTRLSSVGSKDDDDIPQKPKGAIIVQEDRVEGEVTWRTYLNYAKAAGLVSFSASMIVMALAQAVRVTVDYWVSAWTDDKYNLSTYMYLGSYACFVAGATIFSLSRGLLFAKVAITSAKNMHREMITKVLRSPILFFDQNPVGRIVNRLSKDQANVDEILPITAQMMFENLAGCVGAIILVGVLLPWFLLILPPFIIVFFYYQQAYIKTSRELRRLDGTSRSPIYAHFAQTLQGIVSVRAYGVESTMHNRFIELIDGNHRAYILFVHSSRWLGVRLDIAAAVCVTTCSLLVVLLRHSIDPGLAGVVLVQCLQLTGYFQYGVRMMADTENVFTSVERIQAYEKLPSEAAPHSPPGLITDEWPTEGKIEFVKYSMAYREGLPLVLNELTFTINSREKVGILGRTGAGKSSLAAALFRMVENAASQGIILVDNMNLSLVGLDDLRQRFSIIPQDPVLFRGTLRFNLDPFDNYSDVDIFESIGKVHLTNKIKSLENGLSSSVEENGDNFSVGQRQLLCLARSLLRRSKIIVMDEATAAVDGETDQLIQRTMRNVFSDCTVLTIAHRIETVIDCDRVLVLATGGRVAEFDSPVNLLRRADELNAIGQEKSDDHIFANMVFQSGPTVARALREAAEGAERVRMCSRNTDE